MDKLRRGETLNGPEKDIFNRVPEFGARLVENIPRLGSVANIVRYQQKHFDGSGFPADTFSGDEIPIGARIIHVLSDLLELEDQSLSRPAAFQKMQERQGYYDLKVLTAVSCWCDVAPGTAAGADQGPPQSVEIDALRVGHVLAQDLRTTEGVMVLATNTKLTSMLVTKLQNFRALNTIDNTLLVYTT